MKWKKLAAMAKAAYEAELAKKADADQELLAALKEDWEAKQAKAEGDGKGAPDAGKGKGGEAEKAPGADDATKVVDSDALKGMIETAVKAAFAGQAPEAKVDDAAIGKIIDAAIKAALKTDSKTITLAEVNGIVETIVKEQVKSIRQPSKIRFGQEGDEGKDKDNKGMIEMPFGLTKGNLPLHMKQLVNSLLRKPMNEGIDADMIVKGARLGDNLFAAAKVQGAKALVSDVAGSGADFVPRDLASELYRRMYLESRFLQLVMANEIDMPSDPFDLPLSTTRPTFYRNAVQNRNARASTPGTGKFTLTTSKLMALVQYSYEADEDSIIALLPMLQRLLGEAAAAATESAIINGDTAAAHQDTDIDELYAAESSFDGLRKLALAQATLKKDLAVGGISRANLVALKKMLGKWGRNPADLCWLCGSNAENDFLNLDEVVTMDKRGTQATTITGTLTSYLGAPIIVSESSREDLSATGTYDGNTTTKGSVILVNHRQFVMGNRREFTVEVDRNIKAQTNDIVASFRKAFKPAETPSATVKTVAIGYNFNA